MSCIVLNSDYYDVAFEITSNYLNPFMTEDEKKDYKEVLNKHRDSLVSTSLKSQEEFDKTILWLSSGGLGISFTFLKDLIQNEKIEFTWLLTAWICWGFSILFVFASYKTSHMSLEQDISKLNDGLNNGDLANLGASLGNGTFEKITKILNGLGIFLLFAGMASMISFTHINFQNYKSGVIKNDREKTTTTTTTTTSAFEKGGRECSCKGKLEGSSSSEGGSCTPTTTETEGIISKLNDRVTNLEKSIFVSSKRQITHDHNNKQNITKHKTHFHCNNRH